MTADRQARLAAVELYLVATVPRSAARIDSAAALDLLGRVERAVAAGVGMLQLRHKTGDTTARQGWLLALRAALGPDCLLVVNDDIDAVLAPDGEPLADGLHLGRDDARALAPEDVGAGRLAVGLARARERLGDGLLLGTSTRTRDEVIAAHAAGADHAGFGAMAPSPSKADTVLADPAVLRECASELPGFPLFPIGGLYAGNLRTLVVEGAGTWRAAVGSGVLDASDPRDAAAACLAVLRPAHASAARDSGPGDPDQM